MGKRLTTAEFTERAQKVHGDKYIYDKTDLEHRDEKGRVIITCPIHGDFPQNPRKHLQGHGCIYCANNLRKTKEQFISEAHEVHGDKYDYSTIQYINTHTVINIICPTHGSFPQTPKLHLQGCGCKKCGRLKANKAESMTTEEFIGRGRKAHGNKYIYGKTDLDHRDEKGRVIITCPIHGDFPQTPNHHLQGHGCIFCGNRGNGKNGSYTTDEFVEKAHKAHGDKYDYTKTDLDHRDEKGRVIITCPVHGDFPQTPDSHLQGKGCPKCQHQQSKPEQEIIEYLKQFLKPEQIHERNRELLDGKEIDILLPDFHVGIEYNGLYWHNIEHKPEINYHRDKMRLANSKGYRLIQIFEDEWLEHREIVLNKLRHVINADMGEPTIYARKCAVRQINKQIANDFLNTYHIQGFVGSSLYLGAYYNDELVGVMTFKEEKPKMWNLTRFATKTDYKLPGLASKMFKYFTKNYDFDEIKSFLDLRWNQSLNNNTVYDKLGFVLEENIRPDYRYVVGSQRIHKFRMRKHTLNKEYGLPLTMTEREMCDELGFQRIYDCGLAKYVYKNEKDNNNN